MNKYPLKGSSKKTALRKAVPGAVEVATPAPRIGVPA
jgi:hypothetical protein